MTSVATTTLSGALGGNPTSTTAKSLQGQKDQFLQLLLAQLKYQDPLQPPDASKFGEQMTQFGQLEQLFNLNDTLGKMAGSQNGSGRADAISLIGKQVEANDNGLEVTGSHPGSIGFQLNQPADQVTAEIKNSNGFTVNVLHYDSQHAGSQFYDLAAGDLPEGQYTVDLTASDAAGRSISVKPLLRGEVSGVDFSSGGAKVQVAGRSIGMDQIIMVKKA